MFTRDPCVSRKPILYQKEMTVKAAHDDATNKDTITHRVVRNRNQSISWPQLRSERTALLSSSSSLLLLSFSFDSVETSGRKKNGEPESAVLLEERRTLSEMSLNVAGDLAHVLQIVLRGTQTDSQFPGKVKEEQM